MLKRLGIVVALLSTPTVVFAIEGAITRPAAGAVEAQAARTQEQAQPPLAAQPSTDQTAPGEQPAGKKAASTAAQPVPYQFAAAPYFGLSIGPRNTYNGLPVVNKGMAIILAAGAATMFTNHLYFGGEVYVDHNINVRDFPNPPPVSVRSDWSYGLDIVPGYMLTTFILGYVRLGVENTNFTKANGGATAWRVGIGGETNICKRWDFRAEYIYSGYKRISIGRAHIDQFNFGIVYKFT